MDALKEKFSVLGLNPSKMVYTTLQNHLNRLNALLNSHYTGGLIRNAR